MAETQIQLGDIGTTITITVKDENNSIVDISTASTKQIDFEKADGTILTVNASFVTDGTDGKMKYKTISGDISVHGLWSMQGKVILAVGTYKTNTYNFNVYNTIT